MRCFIVWMKHRQNFCRVAKWIKICENIMKCCEHQWNQICWTISTKWHWNIYFNTNRSTRQKGIEKNIWRKKIKMIGNVMIRTSAENIFKPQSAKLSFYFLISKEMKYSKTCECCWNVVSAYTHKLNAWNVDMLEKLVLFYQKRNRPAIISELWLSPVEYSVFSKMKHFGIIQHVELKRALTNEKITWRIPTRKWIEWLQWKIQIENRSASFGKTTLPLDHEAWKTDKIWRKLVRVRDIKSDYKRKQPDEYKKEKWTRTLFDFILWK